METANSKIKWIYTSTNEVEKYKNLLIKNNVKESDIESCIENYEISEFEQNDTYNFASIQFVTYCDNDRNDIKLDSVKIFWFPNEIITITNSNIIYELFKNYKENVDLYNIENTDKLFYIIINKILTQVFQITTGLTNKINAIQNNLFTNEKNSKRITEITSLQKNLVLIEDIYMPQIEIIDNIKNCKSFGFADNKIVDYWKKTIRQYHKIYATTQMYEKIINNICNSFTVSETLQTNSVVKILTIISSILLPLSLIAGLLGMNYKIPLHDYQYSFYIVVFFCFVFVISCVVFFKKINWL